jgi:hypothetical protein
MITNLKQHLFMRGCAIEHRKAVMKFTAMHIVCVYMYTHTHYIYIYINTHL